ncbi:MAG: hypothetical protein U0232_12520 [Thermomicrobiales bacterium]
MIVGGGTAGTALAGILARDTARTVLLLKTGLRAAHRRALGG